MTVTYTAEVATCRGFGCFLKLLARWKGSIYKLVWLDLITFLTMYYTLNILYRTVLDKEQKVIFEQIVKYCATYSDLIPISFVLGFYVTIVMTRWWNQYTTIPWPDTFAVFVSANVHGQDERGRLMRRTVMRYVCLCLTMALSNISPRVKKRFPTLQHLVEAGLLEENEKCIMESFNSKFTKYSKQWMPIVWAASIITRARKEGRIRDDFAVKTLIDELNKFRAQTGLLIQYDTISIPLVYTQVVTLAVYSYFVTAVFGRQWIEGKTLKDGYVNMIDLYFPIFTTLQFFFYMGWLKVAESLINPFGEDDDDFEVNWLIDRDLQVSYMIVDEMHHEHPELIKDQYWDQIFPAQLPYTIETEAFREHHPQPSTANIELPKHSLTSGLASNAKMDDMVGKSILSINNYKFPEHDAEADDSVSGIHFFAGRRPSRNRLGSTNSIQSMAGGMPRVNTVTNALKRFFSREDSARSPGTTPDGQTMPTLVRSGSSTSMTGGNKYHPPGTMRITDQVIEEVDEQMTIQSQRGNESRPTAQSLFANYDEKESVRSDPIDVPRSFNRANSDAIPGHTYMFPNHALFSSSAPDEDSSLRNTPPVAPTIQIDDSYDSEDGKKQESNQNQTEQQDPETGATSTAAGMSQEDNSNFEQLRMAREKERLERQKQKIARSVSQQTSGTVGFDTDFLIDQLTKSRNEGLNRHSYTDQN